MKQHKVFISPSDQKRNTYASGNTNEAEACGKIGAACKAALERCGFAVQLVQYEPMSSKCSKSDAFGAELHLPIHTNAFNGKTSGTRLMCYALSGEGYRACQAIFNVLAPLTPGTSENITAHPELYEIKHASAPTAYVEVDFHDVPTVAQWLIANTEQIGETIAKGVCNYFGESYVEPDAPQPTEPVTPQPTTPSFADQMREYEKQFEDNDCGDWSAEARGWAIANGIINGIGQLDDGKPNYAWEAHVTREQMVTILHRFASLIGKA